MFLNFNEFIQIDFYLIVNIMISFLLSTEFY